MGAFGEKLRKQREQRGITLDAISKVTKINTRMLRALEDEDFDQISGAVFNKGFTGAYAGQVGLDEEEAVTDYLVALRDNQIQANDLCNHGTQTDNLPSNDGELRMFPGPICLRRVSVKSTRCLSSTGG